MQPCQEVDNRGFSVWGGDVMGVRDFILLEFQQGFGL